MKTKTIVIPKNHMQIILAAVAEYVQLQRRTIHPDGIFDAKQRWFPAQSCDCCIGIRRPSAAYPFSLLVHARTAEHIFHQRGLTGIALGDFKVLCRRAKKLSLLAPVSAATAVMPTTQATSQDGPTSAKSSI